MKNITEVYKTQLASTVEEFLTFLLYPRRRYQSTYTDKVNNTSKLEFYSSSFCVTFSLTHSMCFLQFIFMSKSFSLFPILIVSTKEYRHLGHLCPDPVPTQAWQYVKNQDQLVYRLWNQSGFLKSVKFLWVLRARRNLLAQPYFHQRADRSDFPLNVPQTGLL